MPSPTVASPTPEQVLQRLDWHVVRRLDGLLQGDYRTLFRGSGVDFADLDRDGRLDFVTVEMLDPDLRKHLRTIGSAGQTGRPRVSPWQREDLALSLWAALHGLVELDRADMLDGRDAQATLNVMLDVMLAGLATRARPA